RADCVAMESRTGAPVLENASGGRAVAAVVCTWRRPAPAVERCPIRLEDLDPERVARRNIARMGRTAVATRTGRHGAQQIDLRKELDEVAGADRTCLHEIL